MLQGQSQPLSNSWRKFSLLAGYSVAVTFRISCALFQNICCEPGTGAGSQCGRTLSQTGKSGSLQKGWQTRNTRALISSRPEQCHPTPPWSQPLETPGCSQALLGCATYSHWVLLRAQNIWFQGEALSAHGMEESAIKPDRAPCGVWGCLLEGVTWLTRTVRESALQARQWGHHPSSLGWTRAAKDTSRIGTWAVKADGSGILTLWAITGCISGALGHTAWPPQTATSLPSEPWHSCPFKTPLLSTLQCMLLHPALRTKLPFQAYSKSCFELCHNNWHHCCLVKQFPS